MWSTIRKYTYGWFVDLFKSKEQGLDPKKIVAVVKKKTKAERKRIAQAQRKARRAKRRK